MVEHHPFKVLVEGSSPSGPSNMTSQKVINEARKLRKEGYSLREIACEFGISKTTAHDWVAHSVKLDKKAKACILETIKKGRAKGNWEKYHGKYRGKYSKVVLDPGYWNGELVSIIAHFLFDGHVKKGACEYYNSNKALVNKMINLVQKYFGLEAKIYLRESGVYRVIFYSTELSRLIGRKKQELIETISSLRVEEKRSFLRAFFDDEGNVTLDKKYGINRVRGYQKDRKILVLCQKLLNEFDIVSRLEKDCVVINKKVDLMKFKNQINFSEGLFIYNRRSNSVWKKPTLKREILEMITL